MNGPFYIGATGLEAQQRALDVVANNIANINTPGFKRGELRFAELMALDGADPEHPREILQGVSLDSAARVFEPGVLKSTGKALDVALDGEGFLELLAPGGETLLWRGGTLSVNADGLLTGASGLPLKGMINVPADAGDLAIGRDGTVSATAGQAAGRVLGRLDVARVKDLATLTDQGAGLYRAADPAELSAGPGGADGAGAVVQGALEGSNVQLSDEMVTLMIMQRAYAANAQVVQAGDQLMGIVNGLRR